MTAPGGQEIEPGKTQKLVVNISGRAMRDNYTKDIEVETNDPAMPVLKLTVKAEIMEVLSIVPMAIDFGTVKVGSIGLPLPDTDARIVDLDTGKKTLPQGKTGELEVKGPQVMKGYWHKLEETALVLHDGWLLTGDIAYMDKDGYFYIPDRKKDLIKTKDYSIYPRELEDILYEHPMVKFCAVVGKPDPIAGEIPKAYIVLKEGAIISAEEIMAFVNNKIAAYKAIREVEFREELPMSSAGKVLKRQLKAK